MPVLRAVWLVTTLILPVTACSADQTAPATLSATGSEVAEWTVLFDGEDASAWRTYGEDALRPQWQVVDGALTLTEEGGGDITTGTPYEDYELEVVWAVEPGGNSGIFYGVDPSEAQAAWKTGIEYQLLDDALHDNGEDPLTSAGAAFALYPAPRGAVAPGGEENTSRLVVQDGRVRHYLNGTLTADYEVGSDDFVSRVAASKFAKHDGFGRTTDGLVVLQDHKDRVMFKSVRVREF
jgi:hypothetical protein